MEVHTGRALNVLLKDLTSTDATALLSRQSKTLPSDVLRHINLRPADVDGGNPALLKQADHLPWPPALVSDEYRAARHTVGSLLDRGIRQGRSGPVDLQAFTDLQTAVEAMRKQLSLHATDLHPKDYVKAVRFLYDLSDAGAALDYPELAHLIDPSFLSQAMTVTELAAFMAGKRLAFAPAMPGDEAAYDRLYQAMVDCHAFGSRQVALNR
jgi:hypothetical protein